MDILSSIKAVHIIFVVNWFAGLFYIVRLFIYHVEAKDKELPESDILQKQYKIMEKRLWYIITWPSAVIVIATGLYLAFLREDWMQPWLHLKLGAVFLLFMYHLKCGQIYRQLQIDIIKWTSTQLRLWNEVATLFLISIVFIVVMKDLLNWIWGVAGIMGIAVAVMIAVKWYKKRRKNPPS